MSFPMLVNNRIKSSYAVDNAMNNCWLFFNFCFQGLEIVFRVGLALLQMNQAELLQLDMEGMLQVS